MLAEGRILLLLSDWYFRLGPRTHDQWNHALRTVVAPNTDRFAAVTVTDAAMPTAGLNVTELGVAGPREAERRLLARLGTPYSAAPATAAEPTGPRFPRDQPRLWGGVPRRNIRFTGREGALSETYHHLNGAQASAAVLRLLGMSGVGKTQTAAKYVYRFGSEYSRVARRALANSDPGRPTDTRLWPRYAELVPHLEASGSYVSTHGAVQRLVLNCLRYLFLSGEYRTGLQIAERVTPKWHELLGPTHPRVWDLAYHHVNLLRSVGRYAEAEQLDRAAADHLRAERGEHDLDLLRAVTGLAADLRALARYDEALDLQQSVLREYTDLVGEQDSRTLGALNNLAVSYRVLGRYTEALEMDRRALEARRERLRPRHNWTLFSEINYAWDLRLLGRYEEAISIQEPSVEVHRDVMVPDNPQTLRAEHNLAMCLYRQGDRTRGVTLLGDVLERCERVLGDTDSLTLMAASSYGCMQREHGDLDLARRLGERVLDRYREMLGPRPPVRRRQLRQPRAGTAGRGGAAVVGDAGRRGAGHHDRRGRRAAPMDAGHRPQRHRDPQPDGRPGGRRRAEPQDQPPDRRGPVPPAPVGALVPGGARGRPARAARPAAGREGGGGGAERALRHPRLPARAHHLGPLPGQAVLGLREPRALAPPPGRAGRRFAPPPGPGPAVG